MKIMKDLIKKIRSRGRMDAESRWWVAELLAADCEKAWIHPGWEDTMQKWYEWLEKMKKEDEKKNMEEMHQQKVAQMIKSAEGSAGLLHKITKPTAWRGGAQILKKEEEDARLLDRCEAKRKEGQSIGSVMADVQNLEDKPWENEELKKLEEATKAKRVRFGKGFEIVQDENRSGNATASTRFKCVDRSFHPKVHLGLETKETRRRNRGVSWRRWNIEWKVAATSLYDDVLLDTEECHE